MTTPRPYNLTPDKQAVHGCVQTMERIRKEEGAFLSSGWPVREGGSTHDGWGTRHKNVAAVGNLFFFLTLAIDHLVAYNALASKLSFANLVQTVLLSNQRPL